MNEERNALRGQIEVVKRQRGDAERIANGARVLIRQSYLPAFGNLGELDVEQIESTVALLCTEVKKIREYNKTLEQLNEALNG